MYVCVYVCIRVYVRIVYVYTSIWVCTRVSMSTCVYVCMWLRVAAFRTRLCDSNSITRDSNLRSLWIRFTGDTKNDL